MEQVTNMSITTLPLLKMKIVIPLSTLFFSNNKNGPMNNKIIELTLPEWVFLDAHDGKDRPFKR